MIQQHLEHALQDPNLVRDKFSQKYRGLKYSLKAGLDKIEIHLEKALVGDYPFLMNTIWSVVFPFEYDYNIIIIG
jgi:hypothetical protein